MLQGEEREVVLVTLVRSGGTSGFLAMDNRVTVALSRARRGLVLLGNLDTLCRGSSLWGAVRWSCYCQNFRKV